MPFALCTATKTYRMHQSHLPLHYTVHDTFKPSTWKSSEILSTETRALTLSMGYCNWRSCLVTATPTARGVNHLAPPVAASVRENNSPKDDGWLILIVYSQRTKKPSNSSHVHVKMTHYRLCYTAPPRTDISSSPRFDSHLQYAL